MVIPSFTSPEQIHHPHEVDVRSDIFALGALFYMLLVGTPPFRSQTSAEYQRLLGSPYVPPLFPENNTLAQRFKELIIRALQFDPAKRWANIEEFAAGYEKLAAKETLGKIEIKPMSATATAPTYNLLSPKENEELANVPFKQLGKFILYEELGQGAMSMVYRALDSQLKREVALKILKSGTKMTATDAEIERFLRNARASSVLDHPNIATVYEVGKEVGYHYLAVKYIDGLTLSEYQKKHALSPRESFILIRDIGKALHYAHTRDILHRAVKPSNIIVDRNGKPYLMDFGLGLERKSESLFGLRPETSSATPYMSPEQLEGRPASPVQDVYSLGVVLYELLTGQVRGAKVASGKWLAKPFSLARPFSEMAKELSREAESIALRALEKNPGRRYESASAMVEDVDRFLDCRPILARPPAWPFRLWEWVIYYQKTVLSTTAAFLLLTAFVLYSWIIGPMSYQRRETKRLITESERLYHAAQEEYHRQLADIPVAPDPEGLSPASLRAQTQSISSFREYLKSLYRQRLAHEVLPLLRQAFGQQASENKPLLDLLHEVIELGKSEDERRPYRLELLKLLGRSSEEIDQPARVTIHLYPEACHAYLYVFNRHHEGRYSLRAFDIQHRQAIPLTGEEQLDLEAKENVSRAQSLLRDGCFQILARDYEKAKNNLMRAVDLHPDYLEGYFWLACLSFLTTQPNDPWSRRGTQRLTRLPPEEGAVLSDFFEQAFIEKVVACYMKLPHRQSGRGNTPADFLVRVTSLPQQESPLQLGDIIYNVENEPVTTEERFTQLLSRKGQQSCGLMRDFIPLQVVLKSSLLQDPYFQVGEEDPLFYIHRNTPLFSEGLESIYPLFRREENRLTQTEVELPPGSYLILAESPDYWSIRYPMVVQRDVDFGRPFAPEITIVLPPSRKEDRALFADMVPVFASACAFRGEKELANTRGFLLGRYEVTVGEWRRYLESNLPTKPQEALTFLEGASPRLISQRPLFHLHQGKLILRLGNETWPVFGITPRQIQAYLAWRNQTLPAWAQKMKIAWRLPTAEEWMAAARGADGRLYPWGDDPNPQFGKVGEARSYRMALEGIGKYNPAFLSDESPFGINDLGGSLREYVTRGASATIMVKGAGWSDSQVVPIEHLWGPWDTLPQTAVHGFRLCLGLDPFYSDQ